MEFDLISIRNEFLMASLTLWPHTYILQYVNIDIYSTVEKHVENLIGLLM